MLDGLLRHNTFAERVPNGADEALELLLGGLRPDPADSLARLRVRGTAVEHGIRLRGELKYTELLFYAEAKWLSILVSNDMNFAKWTRAGGLTQFIYNLAPAFIWKAA